MLVWARRRANLSIDQLLRRIPHLQAWESGTKKPTFKQLEDFAKATRTPVGFLFLSEPPVEKLPIPDFRAISSELVERPSPDLLDTIYLCQQRQDWYREFARSTWEPPLSFVGSVSIADDVVTTASSMCQALAFDIDERRTMTTWMEALRRFIEHADSLGVLVMVSGVVGSNNRRKLDPHEFRGFALSDNLAPLILINGADTKSAQMFTLAHEMAHIWLGQSAISDSQLLSVPDQAVERWCNQVAAELLVPLDRLCAEHKLGINLREELDRLARTFKVSTLVILRRMHDAGFLSSKAYWKAFDLELGRLQEFSPKKASGGDFYLTLGARVGKRFARALVSSTLEGRSSFSEAFRLLGFKKMSTFHELGHNLGIGY